ncbi:MAG: poly-gamma-glutamate system protein [Myxococcota bacterium]
MRQIYWRPATAPTGVHVLVAVIACGALLSAERFQRVKVAPDFDEKLRAAKVMERGLDVVRTYRARSNLAPIDLDLDPTGSGMIGLASSITTTNSGSLAAKRTTVNPNWAAVIVDLLHRAGVERGDLVAVGTSGSFPALNMAALCAADVVGADPVIIGSAGASSFGANIPEFGWLEMEKLLAESGIFSSRTIAASLGGTRDRALGMDRAGRRRLRQSIDDHGIRFIDVRQEIASIEERMQIYQERAGGRRFAAYINAGGALVSLGPKSVKRLYEPGVNLRPHPRGIGVDSVTMRFLTQGTPVINLSKVVPLAEQYGLPIEPTALPEVGEGPVFANRSHDLRLVAALLAGLAAACYVLLRLELGARLLAIGDAQRKPERMV